MKVKICQFCWLLSDELNSPSNLAKSLPASSVCDKILVFSKSCKHDVGMRKEHKNKCIAAKKKKMMSTF